MNGNLESIFVTKETFDQIIKLINEENDCIRVSEFVSKLVEHYKSTKNNCDSHIVKNPHLGLSSEEWDTV